MVYEQVFINNGNIYKENKIFEGPIVDNYIRDSDADPIWDFYQDTDNGKKQYRSSTEFRKWLLDYDSEHTLDYNDVCPDITLWLGKSYYTNGYTEEDCYFRVDDSAMLQKVSDYYSLSYPITSEIEEKLDNTPELISAYKKGNEYIVVGSIKYLNGSPTHLKFYCIYKQENNLSAFQKGRVFENSNIVEEGYKYHDTEIGQQNIVKTNIRAFRYKEIEGDPFIEWEAVINDTGEVEQYESSKGIRTALAHLTTGNDYNEFDLCPAVNLWLGRSWIGTNETLYFYLESSTMLETVATYYGLSEPCDSTMKAKIDSNPEAFRLRHYDIYELGEGNWVPVVVAAVVFDNKTATTFKLIEITRWNE
jgi:hypothetical protein|tara:strand:+ start:79 stop:1164 length:1086 start_codon:yes stop_codon:yes gene_type:complete